MCRIFTGLLEELISFIELLPLTQSLLQHDTLGSKDQEMVLMPQRSDRPDFMVWRALRAISISKISKLCTYVLVYSAEKFKKKDILINVYAVMNVTIKTSPFKRLFCRQTLLYALIDARCLYRNDFIGVSQYSTYATLYRWRTVLYTSD